MYKSKNDNEKIIIKVIQENINDLNIDIAKKIKESHNKKFEDVKLDSLRKRVGEIRQEYNLKVEEKIKKVIVKDTDLEIDKATYLKKDFEFQKIKDENTDSKKLVKLLRSEIELLTKKLDITLDIENNYKQEKIIIESENGILSEGVSCLNASDWHIEERVDPFTVNHLNEYNPDIAKDSAMNFFKNGLRIHNIISNETKINTIFLNLLGDFISGYIHDDLIEDNYLSPTQAIMLCMDLIGNGIDYLLKNSNCKIIIPCKFGNHPRTTEKMRVSTAYKNSFEWLMYHSLAKEFKNNDRVQFNIENGYLTYIDIFNYTLRLHHGEAIKYQGGVGGLLIPASKAISQWDKEKKAYLDVFGHHHTYMGDTGSHKFVCNGSLIGYNPFAIKIKAPFEKPKQSYFCIHKNYGKIMSTPIFVR